ncbi:MAG: hypothetical protein JJ909_00725 [Roseivirga sp.]|uniref:hypothetical protein n=1 Tax=Roseivirga sp. TaxID=1964215 RepID=UPI001B0D10F2|nr:hypothetical protein [Roseivirga sp.]MBO6659170.1 hypothetical protein [Roseivirga sp.]MBO6759485.1 hypothetical protein [Roseivirga sp.]MBO6908093.1 hypothetical protein [Roseivirga sp.]
MSKHETWRTRKYWDKIGGLLIEEFVAVRATKDHGRRVLDGLIVLGEPKAIHTNNTFDIEGRDIIVVQTKASRLGMHLLGQAYFNILLIERLTPKTLN